MALVTPYAAYVLAETLGVSGVTSVVVASVILSSRTVHLTTAQTRLQLHSVYQTVVFLLESVVFALIGLELPALISDLQNGESAWPAQALAVAATLIAVRALWVFPVLTLRRRQHGRRPWREAAVASWAGARGVVPLAAALSIPLTTASGALVPGRDLVLVLAAAVIVLSLLAQGLTLEPLVRGTGIARPAAAARHEATLARLRITEAGLSWLEQLAVDAAAPDDMIDRLRRNLQAHSRALEDDDGSPATDGSDTDAYTGLRRGLLIASATSSPGCTPTARSAMRPAAASSGSWTSKRQASATGRRARSQNAEEGHPRDGPSRSGHCQQGSRTVSAASAGLRVRLACSVAPGIYTFADDGYSFFRLWPRHAQP